jgi:hypothetical protein
MNTEIYGGMMLTGETPDSFTRALAILATAVVAKQEELATEMNVGLRRITLILRRILLTCRKILHVTDGFTATPKEGVLRSLIALGRILNPRTLASVTSTVTTRPPSTTCVCVIFITGEVMRRPLSPVILSCL